MSRPQPTTRAAPSYVPPTQRASKMAIWSLVLSILWLGGLGSLAGIMLGFAARRKIPQTGERGYGLAIAGIIVGVVTLIVAIGYWVFFARHTGHGGGGGGSGGSGYGY